MMVPTSSVCNETNNQYFILTVRLKHIEVVHIITSVMTIVVRNRTERFEDFLCKSLSFVI